MRARTDNLKLRTNSFFGYFLLSHRLAYFEVSIVRMISLKISYVWNKRMILLPNWFLSLLCLCDPDPHPPPPHLASIGGRVGSLVYRYDEDDLNQTVDPEEKESADEDSRENNSVSFEFWAFWILFLLINHFHSTDVSSWQKNSSRVVCSRSMWCVLRHWIFTEYRGVWKADCLVGSAS